MEVINTHKIRNIMAEAGRLARGSASSRSGLSRAFKPTSAQALMEFVLVSIPLLILMVGIFEFGLAYFDNSKLETTTREVVRLLSVCSNGCDHSDKYRLDSSPPQVPNDIAALGIIGANDYDNPAPLVPGNIVYIHLQRVNIDATLNVYSTTTYVNQSSQLVDASTVKGSDNLPLGLRPFYVHYIYDTSGTATSLAPFVVDTNYTPSGISTSQRPLQNRGWPSKGFDTVNTNLHMNGRNICEPTDRFYVEIAYKHYWVTPMGSLTGLSGSITIYKRLFGKIEPQFFAGGSVAQGVCV